ncbi:MAG: M13-type metalloendopeptidase, partial [Cellulosilyticaceae bacterium]
AGYLSQEFVEAGDTYVATVMGIKGERPIEQKAFQAVNMAFTEEIGRLYVEKCFSEEAKADVKAMVDEIIATYKKRIEKLDWMSAETKENALMKLDKMKVKIGYPDKWESFDGLKLKAYKDGGSLVDNMLSIQRFFREQELEEVNKPVDKGQFLMPPQMVNACYSPLSNDITFPVAILQPPFYDIDAKKETNMGAIGVVIAHEITHAFDNTGARFDGDGNLANWWGEEDYKRFEEKAKKVRDYYGKVEALPGQYINGDLTVGENIADIGAMACMLDMMEDLPDADYKAFFESWATVWRSVAPEAFRVQLLQRDSHAPNKERVNEVVKQFEAFYETYNITEKDGMYLETEERLSIW